MLFVSEGVLSDSSPGSLLGHRPVVPFPGKDVWKSAIMSHMLSGPRGLRQQPAPGQALWWREVVWGLSVGLPRGPAWGWAPSEAPSPPQQDPRPLAEPCLENQSQKPGVQLPSREPDLPRSRERGSRVNAGGQEGHGHLCSICRFQALYETLKGHHS